MDVKWGFRLFQQKTISAEMFVLLIRLEEKETLTTKKGPSLAKIRKKT